LIPAVKTGILEKFGAVVAVGREHLSAAAGESLIPVPLAPPSESRLLSKEPRTRLKIRSFSSGFEPRESGTATKEPFHRARRTGFSPETLYYPGLDGFGNAHQTEGLAPIGCGRISNPSPTTQLYGGAAALALAVDCRCHSETTSRTSSGPAPTSVAAQRQATKFIYITETQRALAAKGMTECAKFRPEPKQRSK
jgi:hypothetical protein